MVGKAACARDWSRAAKDTRLQQPGDLLNPKRRLLRPKKLRHLEQHCSLSCACMQRVRASEAHRKGLNWCI